MLLRGLMAFHHQHTQAHTPWPLPLGGGGVGDAYTCVAAGHGRCRHLMIHLSGLRPHSAHIHLARPSRLYPSPPYRAKFIVLRSNWPACVDTDGAPLLRPPDETRSPLNGQPCERQRHRTARKSEWNGTLLAWHLLRPSVSMAVEAAAASEHVPTHSHTLYTSYLHASLSLRRAFVPRSIRDATRAASRAVDSIFEVRLRLHRCTPAHTWPTPMLCAAGLCLRGRAPYTHGDDKHSITVIPVRTHGVDPNDKHIPECNKRAPPAAHAKPARPWLLCALFCAPVPAAL